MIFFLLINKSEDFQIYILFDTTNTGLTTSVNRWHYRIPFVSMYGFFQFCSIRSTRLNIHAIQEISDIPLISHSQKVLHVRQRVTGLRLQDYLDNLKKYFSFLLT